MEYRSHFVFKNAICFLPRKQDLRLTGKIWNTRLRLNQAHKMHLNWAGRAQILVSENQKAARCLQFSCKTFARARWHLPRYLFPSVQPLAPPRRLPPTITAPVTHSSVHQESSRREANVYSHTQAPPQTADTGKIRLCMLYQ